MLLIHVAIYCYESPIFHTRLLTVWETKAAPASPGRVAGTEVMCLVDCLKFCDIFLCEVDNLAIAYNNGQSKVVFESFVDLLKIRVLVTDFGRTVAREQD